MMNDDREHRIRERAYEIWERNGRSGNPENHWFEAEREFTERDAASPGGAADLTGTAKQAQDTGDSSGKVA